MIVSEEPTYGCDKQKKLFFCPIRFLHKLSLFTDSVLVFAHESFARYLAPSLGGLSCFPLPRYALSDDLLGVFESCSSKIALLISLGQCELHFVVVTSSDLYRNADWQPAGLDSLNQCGLAMLHKMNDAVHVSAVKS